MKIIAKILLLIPKVLNYILMILYKPLFKKSGVGLKFFPLNSTFSFNNILLGDNVFIGDRAYFYASISYIKIGNKVMFGPNVTIRGGNHASHIIGKYMYDYKLADKLPEDDQPVIIGDDVWVGTNVTILKGVNIGRGSIIAAGSVVTKNVDEFCIYGGVPAKKLKERFNSQDLEEHKKMLNII